MDKLLGYFLPSLIATFFFILIGADDISRDEGRRKIVSPNLALMRAGYVFSKLACGFSGGMIVILLIIMAVVKASPPEGVSAVRWFLHSMFAMIVAGVAAVVLCYWAIGLLQNIVRGFQSRSSLKFFPPREMNRG